MTIHYVLNARTKYKTRVFHRVNRLNLWIILESRLEKDRMELDSVCAFWIGLRRILLVGTVSAWHSVQGKDIMFIKVRTPK